MKKTKILHIRDSCGVYGAERVILNLAKHIDKKKFNFILVVFENDNPKCLDIATIAEKLNIRVIVIPLKARFNLTALRKLRKLIIEEKCDIIHGHDFKSNFYSVLASAFLEVKRFVTSHGATRDSMVKRFYLFMDEMVFYRFFDKIIAVSREIRKHLIACKHRSDKIELVENGIDISMLAETDQTALVPLSEEIDDSTKNIGIVGRLFPDKGHRYFIDAFSELVKHNKSIKAWFIGDGPLKGELERQIKNKRMDKFITLIGQRDDMANIYRKMDFIVMPSLREGLPYTLLEAMSYRIPVLATNVGEIPNLIVHQKTGYLVEPQDETALLHALELMVNSPLRNEEITENAFNLVNEHYAAEKMAKKIESLYQIGFLPDSF